jgi:hypothetical protein
LDATYKQAAGFYPRYLYVRKRRHARIHAARLARGVLRYAVETRKPNDQRLREYAETALPAREQAMYSPAPITPSMEIAVLADYFTFLGRELGYNDPTVAALLDGRTPLAAARHAVETSKLIDVEERRRLARTRPPSAPPPTA